MNIAKTGILAVCTLVAVGCTEMGGGDLKVPEMGEKTGMGAAAGGAMGATLGAIVGNQTGSTGTGFVVGALTGAATGAVVGNVLEGQENNVKSQDAFLDKQEQAIRAQGNEIDALRRSSQDSVSFRGDSRLAAKTYQGSAYQGSLNQGANNLGTNNQAPSNQDSAYQGAGGAAYGAGAPPLREATLAVGARTDSTSPSSPTKPATGSDGFAPRLSNDGPATTGSVGTGVAPAAGADTDTSRAAYTWNSANRPDLSSPDCLKSQTEVKDAAAAAENADKLFHYRRAIRLCPNNPAHHNSLGEVYLSLNRKSDAEFEFKEALSADASYEPAKQNLSNITR